MSLRSFLRDHFGLGPSLRNKRDGMAWINSNADEGAGSSTLVGRVVQTRRVLFSDVWEIEPSQNYVCTGAVRFTMTGHTLRAGEVVVIGALRDGCLTPIPRDLVTEQEVDRLYQPGPQIKAKETA